MGASSLFSEHIKSILLSAERLRAAQRTPLPTANLLDPKAHMPIIMESNAAINEWVRLLTPEVVEAMVNSILTGESLPLQVPTRRYDGDELLAPNDDNIVELFQR